MKKKPIKFCIKKNVNLISCEAKTKYPVTIIYCRYKCCGSPNRLVVERFLQVTRFRFQIQIQGWMFVVIRDPL